MLEFLLILLKNLLFIFIYQSEGMLKNNLKFYNRLISRPNEIGFKYYLEDINSGNDKNF